MFKYIKKLTSVVVMFAVIIVFPTSKVYAGSAFSMPPNVEKSAEVVGIVNDLAMLTGNISIGISIGKIRQDVDVDKIKAKKRKVLNMITMIGVHHFFSPTDSKKLDTFMIATMVGSIKILSDIKSDIKKNKKLKIMEPYTDANKISPLNVLNIDYTGGFFNFASSTDATPMFFYDETTPSSTNKLDGTIYNKTKKTVNILTNLQPAGPLCTLEIKMPKSNTLSSGQYYEGVQEADGSWTLSDAGLKKFMQDDATAIEKKGDSSGW
jgi:hypothetical protein